MEKYFEVLCMCPLFRDMAHWELTKALRCLNARVSSFEKGEAVMNEGEPAKYVGIVLTGSFQIVRTDFFGNRSMIANLVPGELFGESFACAGKKIIVSSGMATVEELKVCINILVKAGTEEKDIILLHCNTEYPTPDQDVNILAIMDLKENFSHVSIGFSDHSVGYIAAVGATILGISLIEKHFTLDKNFPGPDHKASATPDELNKKLSQ